MKSDFHLPPLARLAGVWLLSSSFFAVAAIVAFGTYGPKNPVALALAAGGLVCLALWFFGRAQGRKFVQSAPRDDFTRQRALLGVNAISSVLLVAILLVGLNYIASRRHKTFDLTQNRVNSLAPQTVNALGKLAAPVKMTFYYLENQPKPDVQALLQNYRRASDKISVEFVNAPSNPVGLPQSLVSTGQPVLVIQRGTGTTATRQEVSVIDEQNVTSALLKLQNSQATRLAWLGGHGELTLEQLAGLKGALESQNYALQPLALRGPVAVPADLAAVVIAAPSSDLGEDEARALQNYVNGKGRLMVLLAPARPGVQTPRLDALLKTVGVQKGAGIVIDEQTGNFYQSPQIPVGVRGDASRHPVLRGTSADVLFPGAVALQSASSAQWKTTEVFESSSSARAVDAQSGQTVTGQAPFALAIASEKGEARALILSSAALATDGALALFGNQSFLLSGIGWVSGQDALVSIPPKAPITGTLDMPTPVRTFASLFSLLVLPFLALVAGGVVWWRRR